MTDVTSLDSGFDAMDVIVHNSEANLHIRVTMPEDPSFQTIFIINPIDLVWTLKQKVLDSVARDLKDPMNYGFYCPPSNNRVGKFLDEERPIKEYPLSVPIGLLEFKYKKKLYKMDLNPLKLKKMHAPAELKIFMELVKRGEIDQITARMGKGFDPNFNSVNKGETPMTVAATLPRPGAVILALVGGGAFIDYRNRSGMTPLHVATMQGNKDAVRILLDLGSSPNYKDSKGLTPLCYATMKNTPPLCLQWLLQERADIGRKDEKGWMEIHHACERGLTQHLEQLLFYGADRNAIIQGSNETPLHVCAKSNQVDCAHLLLLRGADKTLRNKSNQTPEQVARASGHEGVAKCIADFRSEQVELFTDVPRYNEKRRGTISMVTLRNLQRSRSNPNLLQQLFQQDPVLSATLSQATGVQYFSNGLAPHGMKTSSSSPKLVASELFGTGAKGTIRKENVDSSNRKLVERTIELHRSASGFGFILRGPLDPRGSILNFVPSSDVPARQYIESVDPGSVAEKAGLEAGDFILEINGQSAVFESHEGCVQLVRGCGDTLKLKVAKIQYVESQAKPETVSNHSDVVSKASTEGRDSLDSSSTDDSSQAKAALFGLEALENLDATLDSYDGIVAEATEDQVVNTTVHAPDEFCSDNPSLPDDSDLLPPPPPTTHSDIEVEVNAVFEDAIVSMSDRNSIQNGHLGMPSESELHYDVDASRRSSVVEDEVETSPEPAEVGGVRKKSASLAFAAVSIGVAEGKIAKRDESAEAQTRKRYPAPNITQSNNSASPTTYSKAIRASVIVHASADKADDTRSKINQSEGSANSEVSLAVPPPPPPLPPPAAAVGVASSTLSREKNGAQKQLLEESRKREESHAALMAAVLKRKSVVDSTDSGGLADNIDARIGGTRTLQKTVYRADNTVEVRLPPTGTNGTELLASPEGTLAKPKPSLDNDNTFSAEAEKIRQAFLLRKSMVVASKETPGDGSVSQGISVAANNGKVSPWGEAVDKNEHPRPALGVNGISSGGDVKTWNRNNNRPVSTAVTSSQPVLADVASMIVQKALERQKKEEANAMLSAARPEHFNNSVVKGSVSKQMDDRRSMFEVSSESAKPLPKPSNSRVYTSGNVKVNNATGIANGITPANSLPADSSTLQPKKYGPGITVISSSATKGPVYWKSSARNGAVVASSVNNGEKAPLAVSKHEAAGKMVPMSIIPPPAEFTTPAESNFSNDVYTTGALRNVSKVSRSNSTVFRAKNSSVSESVAGESFQDRSISLWNENDIGDWLDSLDYSQYRAIFDERKITGGALTQLKETDLESMGIKSPLHRIKIGKEIRKYLNKK